MALREPFAAYNAHNNFEAHLVSKLLNDAGIPAMVIEDMSGVGIWWGLTVAEIHKPQVWIEKSDVERATPILAEYDRKNQERLATNHAATARVVGVCEECGARSEFPAALNGTTQNCPKCRAFMDVGELVGFEGWDETPEEDEE